MRILAIEDDLIFAEALRESLERLEHVVIDVTSSPDEFKRLVKATLPDLVVVDIDLGHTLTGIDVVQDMQEFHDCPVIFLTSHEDVETAEEALDAFPAAFLTKPASDAELMSAISLASKPKPMQSPKPSQADDAFFLKIENTLKKLDAKDVLYIEVMGRTCFVITSVERLEVAMRLKDLIKELPGGFVQIHRSYLVNQLHISEVDSQLQSVTLHNQQLPVGRSFKNELLSKINRIG